MDPHPPNAYMKFPRWQLPSGHFLSHVGSAVLAQGLLSAANFTIGLLLLRNAGAEPYAHYVLAANGIALAVSLQTAFLGPPLSTRLPGLSPEAQAALVGGLIAEQRRALSIGVGLLASVTVTAILYHALKASTGIRAPSASGYGVTWAMACGLLAMVTLLRREFLRQTLLALRRAHSILRADVLYASIAVSGAVIACFLPPSAAPPMALLGLAAAGLVSRVWLQQAIHRQLVPMAGRRAGLLQEIAPLALWATGGAALFWLYTQGFLYLVVAKLGAAAVAALAATRLMLMPMNLLSTGLGGLLAPAAAAWLAVDGRTGLLRRLSGIALIVGVVTMVWVALLYRWRDVLFPLLFRQPVAHAGALVLAWGAVYVSMAVRDQLGYLLTALGRYRQLTTLTALATITALASCVAGMLWLPDPRGAMVGIIAGEAVSLLGILVLVLRAVRQKPAFSPVETAFPA
jgi:O-antigen/teichoic acid export membrane protein